MEEPKARWVVEMRPGKASVFLPPGLDRTDWIEVTQPTDAFAVFFDPKNGETYRCEDFRRAAMVAKGLKEQS